MRICVTLLTLLLCSPALEADEATPASRFTVELPAVILQDVPVATVIITARTKSGEIDTSVAGPVPISGILQRVEGEAEPLPPFVAGELKLASNLAQRRKILVTGPIQIGHGDMAFTQAVRVIPGWLSLLPPLIAIVLSIALRNVLISLFAGTWAGVTLLQGGDLVTGLLRTVDTLLLEQLLDRGHLMIILFTLFLGAMINVMSRSGGTAAFVHRLATYTQTRERGQLLTWGLGLVVFFDDYANSLLVGSTMRPVTDRLRISREKLAFLVDATAAPVAGLALISTWVGVEISYIEDTYQELGLQGNIYGVFLSTLPYRFYPWLMLIFVGIIAATGRDFGLMLRSEKRALSLGHVNRQNAFVAVNDVQSWANPQREFSCNALIPLGCLIGFVLYGMTQTGTNGDSNGVLLLSSFFASAIAVFIVTGTRALSLNRAVEAWIEGANHMLLAVLILALAWGIAATCQNQSLNTAGYLVEISDDFISVRWMPALAFITSSAIAFATGSSWATMGLLMPLFISLTYALLVPLGDVSPTQHLLLGTIGAVLAGAIFGDHCSPISDTTVLSSAAAQCDHLDHVATQMPYALLVGAVSVLFGYIPVGFQDQWLSGLPEAMQGPVTVAVPFFSLALASVFLWGGVRFFATRAEADPTASLQ